MRSKEKFDFVFVEKPNEKLWVELRPKEDYISEGWRPSFEDLFRYIRMIGYCEDLAYPKGKGRVMVAEFLEALAESIRESPYIRDEEGEEEAQWRLLRREFGLK